MTERRKFVDPKTGLVWTEKEESGTPNIDQAFVDTEAWKAKAAAGETRKKRKMNAQDSMDALRYMMGKANGPGDMWRLQGAKPHGSDVERTCRFCHLPIWLCPKGGVL